MNNIRISLSILLVFVIVQASGQKQLVLLHRGRVIERYFPGDDIACRLKDWHYKKGFVNNLSDTSVVTLDDTMQFLDIRRVWYKKPHQIWVIQQLGRLGIATGLFFMIDDLNHNVLKGKESDYKQVIAANLVALHSGVAMNLIKRRSRKIWRHNKLMTVKKGSPLYKEDPRGFDSPFIPN